VRFWKSWYASTKHAASKKRQVVLHFWDFSNAFQEVSLEFANATNEDDFGRDFLKKMINYNSVIG